MAVSTRWTSLKTDPRTLSALSVSVHGLRPAAVRGRDRAAGLLPAERQLRALLQETPAALRAITQPMDQRLSAEQLKRQPGKGLATGGVTLPMALAELGLLDEYEFMVQPRLAGHGPTLFAGLSKHVDLTLVSRREFASGAVAMRYEPRR